MTTLKTLSIALVAAATALVATPRAEATVDMLSEYSIAYSDIQTDDICLGRQTMWLTAGIPLHSMARATASVTKIFRDTTPATFVNINLAGTTPAMVPTYVSDQVVGGIWEYSMKLDVTALKTANGTTVAGRQATIKAAKLFLLAMAENMEYVSPGAWKLRVQFVGLPSQTGLSGTVLYATTTYPYTSTSTLLAQYRAQLINLNGTCP